MGEYCCHGDSFIIINKKAPIVGEEVLFSLADETAIRLGHTSPSTLQNDWIDGIVR